MVLSLEEQVMEVTEASTFLFVFWCGEINRLSGPRLVSGSMSG